MNNNFYPIFALLALFVCFEAGGQEFLSRQIDTTAPAPDMPFIKSPEAIAYTASFAYKDSPSAKSSPSQQGDDSARKVIEPRIKAIAVEMVGDLRHDNRQWEGGETPAKELWYSQTAAFKEGTDARGKPNGIHSEPAFAKGAEAFPELTWVGKDNFVGVIQAGELLIDVYRYKFVADDVGGFTPIFFQNEEVTAYIDRKTRLPLSVKTSQYLLSYTYRTPPTSLNPPVEYLTAFQKYKEKKARIPRIP